MRTIYCDWLKVYIHIFNSFKDYKKMCSENGFETDFVWEKNYDALALREVFDGFPYFSIILKRKTTPIVIHEISHLTDYIFDNKGIPISIENTETRAYFQEWLYRKIMGLS